MFIKYNIIVLLQIGCQKEIIRLRIIIIRAAKHSFDTY